MILPGVWLMPQHLLDSYGEIEWRPTDEEVQAFITRRSRSGGGEDLFLRDDEGTARIPIVGVLTKEPSFFFDLFGGGSSVYGDLIEAVHTADGDPGITRIVLDIDSPGGDVSGLFELVQAIAGTSTPIVAEVTDMAASAAFAVAAATDSIVVNNPMASVGSIGVVTRRFVGEGVVRITSTAAPLKAADAGTPEGVAAIKAELDAIHAEFVTIIAQGRSAALGREVTTEEVNAEFGRGAIVLAGRALAVGMIDGIASASFETRNPGRAPDTGAQTMADRLTLESFRADNRELYDSIRTDARAEGHSEGVAVERDRVAAHCVAGGNTGNTALALELIADGSAFSSQAVQARYLGAARNAGDDAARRGDDTDADPGSGADAAAAADAGKAKANTPPGELSDEQVEAIFNEV